VGNLQAIQVRPRGRSFSRWLAERRIFPAIDLVASSTRREELLLGPEALVVVRALRQRIAAMSPANALGDVLNELKATTTNEELIRKLAASEARRA